MCTACIRQAEDREGDSRGVGVGRSGEDGGMDVGRRVSRGLCRAVRTTPLSLSLVPFSNTSRRWRGSDRSCSGHQHITYDANFVFFGAVKYCLGGGKRGRGRAGQISRQYRKSAYLSKSEISLLCRPASPSAEHMQPNRRHRGIAILILISLTS